MGLFGFGKKKSPCDIAPENAQFVMPIEDVFNISGAGVVLIGTVAMGTVGVYDTVDISCGISAEITGIEYNGSSIATAEQGKRVGLLFADMIPNSVRKGMVVYKL